jgi:Protein of unknown function (DUF1588)
MDSEKHPRNAGASSSAECAPLRENEGAQQPTSLRARMEAHRKNSVCAACHKIMDPIGFSLDNFDLIGTWRTTELGAKIDATGQLVLLTANPKELNLRFSRSATQGGPFFTENGKDVWAISRRAGYLCRPPVAVAVAP